MKENKICHYTTAIFDLINISKKRDKVNIDCCNSRVELLDKSSALDKNLTQMFCNYIFLSAKTKLRKINEVEVNSYDKFIIKDNSQSFLNIEELVDDLYVYYFAYTRRNRIDFIINNQLDWISLSMVKESFYQIIFSIIDNKLQFLGAGDVLCLNLEKKNNKLVVSIQDNGFILLESHIKKHEKPLVKRSNLFFLSWDEINNVLDFYGYHYQMKNINKTNDFKIEFGINDVSFADQNQK